MEKVIGYIMLSIPFIAMIIFMVYDMGWKLTLIALGIMTGGICWIIIAAHLIG